MGFEIKIHAESEETEAQLREFLSTHQGLQLIESKPDSQSIARAFRNYLRAYAAEVTSLLEPPDAPLTISQESAYQKLAKAIDNHTRTQIRLSLVEDCAQFRKAMVNVLLRCCDEKANFIPTTNFRLARWQNPAIVRPHEAQALILKYGLRTGSGLSYPQIAPQLEYKRGSSVMNLVHSALYTIGSPLNMLSLKREALIQGEHAEQKN